MRLYADDPGRVVKVQWYFVPQSTKVMPYYTPFRSRYDIRHEPVAEVLGEDVRTIRKHAAGNIRRGPGLTYCGNQRQWEEGCSILDPLPPANVLTGLPCCCGPGTMLSVGGGVGASGPDGFLQQEDLYYLLQEDTGRVIVT